MHGAGEDVDARVGGSGSEGYGADDGARTDRGHQIIDGRGGVVVGDGIRSDYQPLNEGTGIALGNPVNLNYAAGSPYAPDWNQSPYAFQSYSHYIQPGGLVESFIDSIGGNHDGNPVRGGSLAPTVKLDINGDTTSVDRSYGTNGLGGFGHIPANKSYDPGYDKR